MIETTARETKTITTTGGHAVVINAYLTGRESNEAKNVLFEGIEVEAGASERPRFALNRMAPYEQAVLKKLVVSFDGDASDAIDKLENLPSDEYEDAVKQIKKASNAFLGQTTSTTPGE